MTTPLAQSHPIKLSSCLAFFFNLLLFQDYFERPIVLSSYKLPIRIMKRVVCERMTFTYLGLHLNKRKFIYGRHIEGFFCLFWNGSMNYEASKIVVLF